jgi:uncharacterized RDD family membrane protein YckC
MIAETHTPAEPRAMAFDPAAQPELYDGVRTRRIFAFLVDAAVILFLMVLASFVVAVLGLFTFGLGWLLFPLIWPFVAILYTMFTLGGPHSATPGMRFNGIQMRDRDGAPMYPLLALVHAVGFWLSVTILTPLVLLVSLLSPRKRLLHDILIGTIVIRRL